MAQSGFTPIQLYSSSTAGSTPAAGSLMNSAGGSELAINITDGKLFYKDNSGNVQVIGWKIVPVSAGGTGQTSYTDGQLLIGNSTGNTLTKATLTAGTGISITNGAGAITISATGGTGTVTSVSGTAPISVANGTTTPVISISQAGASTDGYLSSTDWNTFNNKISMVYPGAGIPNSTGTAWGTSYTTTGTGTVVALQIAASLSNPTISNYVDFGNGSATTLAAGRMWYDGTTGSWNLGMGGGNITQQVGEEQFIYGKASAAITEGQLICKTGANGASGVITFAPSPANLTDNDGIIGVATENIALNGFGRITTFGVVHGINTTGASVGETWADGDTLWYNPAGSGKLTNVKPSAPNIKFSVATVTHAGPGGSGSIQVDMTPGSVLGGTDANVQMSTPSNGQILTYDGSATYWKNTSLTAGTGISVSASSGGVLTITNTSPSSGGTVTSVSGTGTVNGLTLTGTVTTTGSLTLGGTLSGIANSALTNSSITINGSAISLGGSVSVGTVTSVAALTLGTSGTDLSSTVANGTTTPVITLNVPTASATNRGALSSTDWSTFNGKQAALVSGTNIKTVGGVSLLGSGDVGTIGVGYGGTGQTSFTAGRVLYGNNGSAISSSANFSFNGAGALTLSTTGSSTIAGQLILNNTTGGFNDQTAVTFQSSGTTRGQILSNVDGGAGGSGSLQFWTLTNTGGTFSEAARIDNAQNFLIGTTSSLTGAKFVTYGSGNGTTVIPYQTNYMNNTVGANTAWTWRLNATNFYLSRSVQPNYTTFTDLLSVNSSGDLNVTGTTTTVVIKSNSGTTAAIANGATETITLPAAGVYLFVGRQSSPSNGGIRAAAIVAQGSSTNGTTALFSSGMAFSSGAGFGVILTNNAGGTSAFDWSYTRLL